MRTNRIKVLLSLFATGFLQVFFAGANIFFIGKKFWLGIVLSSFMISWIWSLNVRKIAFGNKTDRFMYSFGAASGCLFSVMVGENLLKLLQCVNLPWIN